MYAIVESRGKQYKVTSGDLVVLDLLNKSQGDSYKFDKVCMFVDDEQNVILDKEKLEKIDISCVVTDEKKGDKLIIFKYKRRKDYHRKRGHRQKYTVVRVEEIKNLDAKAEEIESQDAKAEEIESQDANNSLMGTYED